MFRIHMKYAETYEYAEIPNVEVYKSRSEGCNNKYWLSVVKEEDKSGCINNQS